MICIKTSYICPPMVNRRFDWTACRDGHEEEGFYGYGRTQEEAIDELFEVLENLT